MQVRRDQGGQAPKIWMRRDRTAICRMDGGRDRWREKGRRVDRSDRGVDSTKTGGETDAGLTAADVRKTLETRGNPQYDRTAPCSLPIRNRYTETGWTAADVSRTPERRVNTQYGIPALISRT